mgnify:FL=1|tara:strand:- start:1711 stop:2121 length:411 start_codon:yes stop_codon:yes gene_type:complete
MFAIIGQKIVTRLNSQSAFTTANGNNKVFPVRVSQDAPYPATTYEIRDVDNFLSKDSSLKSCNVRIGINCFATDYTTTYSQAKAVIESLDLYSITYTEDSVSYTAKFNFDSLSDEYFNTPEVFYKEIIFNCLIYKN